MTDQRQIWAFPIQWGANFEEEFAFSTSIFTSRDGTEQRRALRIKPRVNYAFTSVVHQDNFRDAIPRLAEAQARSMVIPYPREFARLSSTVVSGGTSLVLDSVPTWLSTATQLAVVPPGVAKAELVDIASAVSNTVTTTDALLDDHVAGSKVMQVVSGRLSGVSEVRGGTTQTATVEVAFDADPVARPLPDYGNPTTTFGTPAREVMELSPNYAAGVQHGMEQDYVNIDLGRGATDAFFPVAKTNRTTQVRYLLRTENQINDLLGLYYRNRGRWRSFYSPLWAAEIEPLGDIEDLSTMITVQGRDVHDAYASAPMYRNVALKLKSQGFAYHSLASVTLDGSNNSVLNTTNIISPAVPKSDVYWAGWLARCRFASDRLSLEWMSDGVAQATVTYTLLEDEDFDNGGPFAGY